MLGFVFAVIKETSKEMQKRLSGIAVCGFQNIPRMKTRIGDVFFSKFQFEGIFMGRDEELYKSTANGECIFR